MSSARLSFCEGMEVANGQAVNEESIQEEPEVNGGAEEEMEEN